ncbi:hypothetical protein HDU93_007258 [Gonapodya sp. JEL0774]|nr:hypothetical protein HDU93_007258 [Gonapodya sp. JEL0774]
MSNSPSTPRADDSMGSFEQQLEQRFESIYRAIRSAGISWGAISGTPNEIMRAPIKDSGWRGRAKEKHINANSLVEAQAEKGGLGSDNPAWSNPFYPLAGPPSSPEEQAKVNEYIAKEKIAITTALNDPSVSLLRMTSVLAAQENCADLEYTYRSCTLGTAARPSAGDTPVSWWSRISGCAREEAVWTACVVGQKKILEDMGFDDKRRSVEELDWMLQESDRKFWAEKTRLSGAENKS